MTHHDITFGGSSFRPGSSATVRRTTAPSIDAGSLWLDELFDKIRVAYENVCLKNAELEMEVTRLLHNESINKEAVSQVVHQDLPARVVTDEWKPMASAPLVFTGSSQMANLGSEFSIQQPVSHHGILYRDANILSPKGEMPPLRIESGLGDIPRNSFMSEASLPQQSGASIFRPSAVPRLPPLPSSDVPRFESECVIDESNIEVSSCLKGLDRVSMKSLSDELIHNCSARSSTIVFASGSDERARRVSLVVPDEDPKPCQPPASGQKMEVAARSALKPPGTRESERSTRFEAPETIDAPTRSSTAVLATTSSLGTNQEVHPVISQALVQIATQHAEISQKISDFDRKSRKMSKRGTRPTERIDTKSTKDPERFRVSTLPRASQRSGESIGKFKSEMKTLSLNRRKRKPPLQRLLNSRVFDIVVLVVILGYSSLIGLEADMEARGNDVRMPSFATAHLAFNIFFVTELVLRIVANGKDFIYMEDWRWNFFDVLCVFTIVVEFVVEIWLSFTQSFHDIGKVVRSIRIARLIRTLRCIQSFKSAHTIQKIAFALAASVKTLACSMFILCYVMFFFAVLFTQAVADYREKKGHESKSDVYTGSGGTKEFCTADHKESLDLRFGNLFASMYTLFLSASNGIAWDSCFSPLDKISTSLACAFLLYIMIVLFGVLNIVTSVFVESAVMSAQHYKHLLIADRQREKNMAVEHMKEVFKTIDQDGSGEISANELEYYWDNPQFRQYLDALEISPDDARTLFRLLDRDGSNAIDFDEFSEGCLRLKGDARSIDVHILIFQVKSFLAKWSEFAKEIAKMVRELKKEVGEVRADQLLDFEDSSDEDFEDIQAVDLSPKQRQISSSSTGAVTNPSAFFSEEVDEMPDTPPPTPKPSSALAKWRSGCKKAVSKARALEAENARLRVASLEHENATLRAFNRAISTGEPEKAEITRASAATLSSQGSSLQATLLSQGSMLYQSLQSTGSSAMPSMPSTSGGGNVQL